jgi:hypothetical protein
MPPFWKRKELKMKPILPIAALAAGMVSLAACSDDNQMAENTYSVPSERDSSSYPSDGTISSPPGALANPPATDTGRLTPPSDVDDLPPSPTPGAPPPTLPPT